MSGLVVAMERALSLVSDRIVCVSQAEKEEAVSAGIPEQRCEDRSAVRAAGGDVTQPVDDQYREALTGIGSLEV